ncbi:amino acid permease [Candidatus Neptunochlamydia vexilliferae]|uniref:Tyrosine-specific transport protein n=1 Tax=Candidatus Neptunichlamydia vexilliferae TaxID=1651774 RepID=A0ABS0B0I3_9BACT|nr:aromatic amino acid transport family protein [Candidatus Neptunochlamydia vexilliferae]MBF5059906.1 Tyrosine-specific transport protein [Candidatus Neptunochlamydia vexilliferae]
MTRKPGSVFGGTLLITGSCIGAGMLGLPILTGIPGFFPSSIMFFIAWLFMLTTALLMVEIQGWFNKPVNLISMVEHTLGPIGKVLCWLLYLFLFYALLVAYMSLSGNHTSLFVDRTFHLPLSNWTGSLFFVIVFGWMVYLGAKPVDHLNRYLMIGKILSFVLLVMLGAQYIAPRLLIHWQPKYALFTFPILIISFGFHNMIPVLMKYMGGDRVRVRKTIYAGSLFTFAIYLIWEVVTLGILPYTDILHSYKIDIDAAQAIRTYLGSTLIGYSVQSLAFFAILTSFLAQALSLTNFLSDGFKIKHTHRENIGMCLLALIPPLILSILYPEIFFQAINFAGGICAVVLFGIFPVLMAWIGRYQKKNLLPDRVPGGRLLLIALLLIATFIFFDEATTMLNFNLFPKP